MMVTLHYLLVVNRITSVLVVKLLLKGLLLVLILAVVLHVKRVITISLIRVVFIYFTLAKVLTIVR